MHFATKAGFLIMAGMGATWVAYEASDAFLAPSVSRLTQATGAAPAPAATTPPIKQLSKEELEEELKKAQAAMSEAGSKDVSPDEIREFRPTKPLPADLPVSLPSDI